jgi:hypothetical protein
LWGRREETQQKGTRSAPFLLFGVWKQPETAQKVDLKLRDVNPDRNGSKSGSSCRGKSVETGQEVGCPRPLEAPSYVCPGKLPKSVLKSPIIGG